MQFDAIPKARLCNARIQKKKKEKSTMKDMMLIWCNGQNHMENMVPEEG